MDKTIAKNTVTKQEIIAIAGEEVSLEKLKQIVLDDYRLACKSRQMSILSRREVLTGKAKFGIIGDGKELPQIALSKVFQKGDFRSGYYRDQTLMMAIGGITVEQFFAQLYADSDLTHEPNSGGRQMNAHFATRLIDENGNWNDLMSMKNTSADISCTAGQMPRSLGLALASKKYRNIESLHQYRQFSNQGNEVCFVNIGDASTSEGHFWETINAAGVLQVPLVVSVWDDGYGISVPTKYQTTKGSISTILQGFQSDENGAGFEIYTVWGWDYPTLCEAYRKGVEKARRTHTPVIFHIKELTQPQGHSTSGSHERYKSKERLSWETDYDCNKKVREWILKHDLATEEELLAIEKNIAQTVKQQQRASWAAFMKPIHTNIKEVEHICKQIILKVKNKDIVRQVVKELKATHHPLKKDIAAAVRTLLYKLKSEDSSVKADLIAWKNNFQQKNTKTYRSHLYSESAYSPLNVKIVSAKYSQNSKIVNGYEILQSFFDGILKNNPKVMVFGEDVGKIGDVNQGMAGMQEKYGEGRVFDTGIRETTIVGQGIGLAMRGLRPIAEIQYLDYLLYGLQTLSDDLASLHYRTCGGQKAPLIIRTRGHRLEGIWHAGSPIGMIINTLRGMHLCVPRNMTQAAGMYNTLLQGDDPAIVIECLNGYRLKEKMPENLADFTVALGQPEIIRDGEDITIVTYGSCCRVALAAAKQLEGLDISCEIIDVQTLLPFDINHLIVKSIEKTNRILFLDEDVPSGATAYMLQKVMEEQGAYQHLDSAPATLAAAPNRPAYGSDGDYYCKPSVEDVVEKIYSIMHEAEPFYYPEIF